MSTTVLTLPDAYCEVGAVVAEQRVVPAQAVDRVVGRRTGQRVVAVRAVDHRWCRRRRGCRSWRWRRSWRRTRGAKYGDVARCDCRRALERGDQLRRAG